MYEFVLNHFKQFVAVCTVTCMLYMYVWTFCKPKQTNRHSLSIFVYLVSVLVRV